MDLSKSLSHPIFKTVGDVAEHLGTQAYVVGGYTRDILLHRPSKDIDFVCVGSGIQLAEQVAKTLGPKVPVSVFKNFGTAQIRVGDLSLSS
jgi:tRNA nucleotidyltransferase/poly(A) polymerase